MPAAFAMGSLVPICPSKNPMPNGTSENASEAPSIKAIPAGGTLPSDDPNTAMPKPMLNPPIIKVTDRQPKVICSPYESG